MFDQALEDHSASTKKHLRWVNEQFANKLTTARQANREEIKDTIALDKALLKERMREVKRRQAAEIEVRNATTRCAYENSEHARTHAHTHSHTH